MISLSKYTLESRRSLKKKSIPLTVQAMEDPVVRKTTLFLFHMKRFWVLIPGEVNSLYYLWYHQIHYYKHYKKPEFDDPEIHDAAQKV